MADRSDDIKQLFSHLGLNPGDYQEIRDKSAATRSETLTPTFARTQAPTQLQPPTVAVPTRQHSPTITIAPTLVAAPPAAAAAPSPATRQQAPVAPPPLQDPATRWPLLRAAVETPTRVAQIDRSAAAPEAPPQPIEPAVIEDAPTRRLFQELSRRPVDEAVDQLAEAARRRWQEPAAAPEAPPPPQMPPSPPPVAAAPSVAAEVHQPQTDEISTAKSELLSTFRRLVAPERVPAQRPARLHFNYSADASAPHSKQPREEKLDDVFNRISDPRFTR
jgi:hypothetical protein